ncbi:hypothetical protein [Flavonifractor plautii]|uniref:hypothetical protein n=1 Tax=Flavonifractor plautii TaxID=292800 RepID=UPI003EEC7717
MASIQERLNRLRGESSEASVYERLNHLRQIGQSQETESAAGGAGPAPAQRTVKSAPPAALPESKGKALTLPKAGERGFLAGGVSVEGSPFLYGSERAAAALLGAGEGVTDFIGSGFYKGVQGISSLGGLAPNPVSEWAGRNADAFLENSVTRDYEESIRERYRPSQGAENLTGIGQTIVQMLPGIGASKIVSAAGKGLNAAQAISRGENVGRALFGLQAAGNSASQAKAEGADTGQALAFGAASGALETAIEGIAGGIPGLGGGKVGKIAEAVKASPLVSRALDIAGEGGEEALSTFLTPYIQRAIYNPEAENATLGEIGQSALMGAVAAGVLQGGLELPGAISNAASDIRTTRRAIGSNQDIARRATANIQAGQNMARYSSGNPLAAMLPTGEEALAGKRAYLPGSPVYQRNVVDNPSGAGYDGGNQTETGGVTYERGKETSAALEGVHGASLQAETPGSEETYRGRMGGVLEEGRRVQQPESWAQGHIIRTPSAQAQNAASRAKQYSSDVFIVDDAALKSRNPNAWAVTSGGKIYISDAVPAELADAVGYHESVHVLRQQDNEAYHGFLSDESRFLNRSSETAMDLLDLVVDARFPGKSIMDLTPEEAAITYDELNALVWGYHKADPENARAQFSGAFQDYDAYIQELDTIMEGARQPVENQTGVGPAQAQGPESSVGAARANFTGDTERGFSKNLATDRARHPDIQEDFQLDPEKYFRLSNKKTLQKAQDIFSTGLDNARSTVEQALGRAQEGRKLAPEIVPLSKMVADALAAQGDMNGARRILAGVAAELTSAGQLGQAAKILRDADPKTTIESVERIVDNLNDALGGKNKIVVDKALIDEYDRQTDNAGRADVLDQIYDSVASQIPSTPLDKFNALRYTNMLGNIKTQVRNVGGNLIMKGVRTRRVKVQAAIEALAQKRGMDFERTTSFTRDREIYKLAKEEFDAAQAEIMGEQKYSYNGKSVPAAIHNRRTIFKNNGTWGTDPHSPAYLLRKGTDFLWKLPEGYRRLTNWAMEKGDIVFAKSAYADALSRYLKANGITVERYKSGDVDYELLERAQAYAVREAQEATFRDSNAFSDMIASIGFRKADTLPKKVVNTALQGSLPFRRTPANVTVRAVEYSPLGLIDTAVKGISKARGNENITSAEVIRSMSKTLTGSGLFAVGAVLGAAGFLSGLGSSDEEEARLDEQSGRQDYAIYLPDWLTELVGLPKGFNFTLDWASPASVPLFMGAELGTAWEENGFQWKDLWTALGSSSNVLLNMSMLQGVDDQLSNISYSEQPLVDLVMNSLTNFITAGLTNTLLGQLERTIEDKRMTTYTDKNLELPTDWQYELGRASSRTPGWDYQQIPYIDAWGREESNGSMLPRAFNQFLNPSYTSSNTETPVIRESRRLYELTGESGVVAERPEKEITVDGEKIFLNAGQYVQYATIQGRTQNEILSEILDSSAYQNLDTQKRVSVFEDAYKYADAVGKASVSSFKPEGWVADLMDSGLPPENYILFRAATVDIEGDKDENGKTIPGSKKKKVLNVIDQMNVSDEVKDKYYYAAGYAEDTISDAPWHGWGWW